MSRSEFFTRAASRYLDELDSDSLTDQIDAAIAIIDGIDDSTAVATQIGRRLVSETTDEW